jgi:hypothetical protein
MTGARGDGPGMENSAGAFMKKLKLPNSIKTNGFMASSFFLFIKNGGYWQICFQAQVDETPINY